jgi:hypothetical protein
MGCEIGNEKGWGDVVVGVATGTGTAWDYYSTVNVVAIVLHRSYNPNPSE